MHPAILHTLGQASRVRPALSFALAAADARRAQTAKLGEILARNADTEVGRLHGFADVRTPEDYARRVPLMTPADLEPWVRRSMAGERNLLTREAPIYYVRTTGSTGAPKHVPITPSYRADFQRTVHVALFHLHRRFPRAFLSTALYFVGSRRVARAPDGNDVGTMSGFNFTELPELVRAIYAWPYELFEVADLKSRTFLALLLATIGDPSLIAGIFPAPIVYLLRDLGAHAGELAFTLRTGALPGWLALEPTRRAFMERRLGGPRARLAARVAAAERAREEEQASLVWPSLRLVYCWTTAAAALYVPELQRRLPGVAVRDAIYSACESWASIPMGEEAPGGALAIQSGYFELIDEAEYEAGGRTTRPAWELEDGHRYYLVVTTAGGLYRYLLGDVVEVCGWYRSTPRIRFVRKGGAASNLLGEKLEEAHVNRAVGEALARARREATFFCLAPALGGERPGYALHLESRGEPLTPAAREALCADVDARLGEASFDYARLRAAGQLAPATLRILPAGTYDAHRQERVRDGSAEAQLKIAHLVADAATLPFLARPG
jgi:hypothetical protein